MDSYVSREMSVVCGFTQSIETSNSIDPMIFLEEMSKWQSQDDTAQCYCLIT